MPQPDGQRRPAATGDSVTICARGRRAAIQFGAIADLMIRLHAMGVARDADVRVITTFGGRIRRLTVSGIDVAGLARAIPPGMQLAGREADSDH